MADHYEVDVTPVGSTVESDGYMIGKTTLTDLLTRAQAERDAASPNSNDYFYALGVIGTVQWIMGTLGDPYGG